MADIRDPRILWTKWGLFILLGSLASAILLLQANSLTATLMLAIAVWSFCRAYYFAFYGIEKYVDSHFKYAGIWSLIDYWIAKGSNKPSIHRSGLVDIDAGINSDSNKRLVYLDLAKWFLVALLANSIVPMLFGIWSRNSLWPLYLLNSLNSHLSELIIWCLFSILLGFACVEIALASIFGALMDSPAKYRVPLPIVATYFLTIAYLIGLHAADVLQRSRPDVHVVALMMAGGVVSTIVGIVLLLGYRRWSRSVLCCEPHNGNEAPRNKRSQERQFGIQYLMIATTIIAIGIAVARVFRILSLDSLDGRFSVAFLAGLITLLFAVVITLLSIELIFRKTTQRAFRIRLISLLFSLACFPAMIIPLCSAIPGNNSGVADTESYAMLYTFFASYCGLLLWICFQFRKRSVRLLTVDNSEKPIMPGSGIKEETEN